MLSRLTFIQMWIKVYNSLDSRCSIGTMYGAIFVSEVEGIEVGGRINSRKEEEIIGKDLFRRKV